MWVGQIRGQSLRLQLALHTSQLNGGKRVGIAPAPCRVWGGFLTVGYCRQICTSRHLPSALLALSGQPFHLVRF